MTALPLVVRMGQPAESNAVSLFLSRTLCAMPRCTLGASVPSYKFGFEGRDFETYSMSVPWCQPLCFVSSSIHPATYHWVCPVYNGATSLKDLSCGPGFPEGIIVWAYAEVLCNTWDSGVTKYVGFIRNMILSMMLNPPNELGCRSSLMNIYLS